MKEDECATGQRWYCKICSARYKTKFGMLIEIRNYQHVYFALTKCPNMDIEDVRAMHLEATHDPRLVVFLLTARVVRGTRRS